MCRQKLIPNVRSCCNMMSLSDGAMVLSIMLLVENVAVILFISIGSDRIEQATKGELTMPLLIAIIIPYVINCMLCLCLLVAVYQERPRVIYCWLWCFFGIQCTVCLGHVAFSMFVIGCSNFLFLCHLLVGAEILTSLYTIVAVCSLYRLMTSTTPDDIAWLRHRTPGPTVNHQQKC